MKFLAAAPLLLLGGCLQIAVLGEPGGAVTSSTGRPTAAASSSGGSGSGSGANATGSGSTSGHSTTGTSTGSVCPACAPGASCVDNYCRCPNDSPFVSCPANRDNYCDNSVCVACHVQQGGSLYPDGACLIPLASPISAPGCMAVNKTSVIWIDSNGIESTLIPIDSGPKTVLLRRGESFGCLAADDDRIYFTDQSDQTVRSMLLDGGAAAPGDRPLALGQGISNAIFVDGTNVYWASNANGEVRQANKIDGSNQIILAHPSEIGGNPSGIAANGVYVVWATFDDGRVLKVPIGGGTPPILLASTEGEPSAIAVDATNVYWSDYFAGGIKRVSLTGTDGGPAPSFASARGSQGIAVDSQYVYWTTSTPGTVSVFRQPIDGGLPQALDSNPIASYRIVVHGGRAYWNTLPPNAGVYELTPK